MTPLRWIAVALWIWAIYLYLPSWHRSTVKWFLYRKALSAIKRQRRIRRFRKQYPWLYENTDRKETSTP